MKKYLRFILPIFIILIIIVLVLISKVDNKSTGKDLYISFEEATTEKNNYIDGVYESLVKPNYSIIENDTGDKAIITDSLEVSINTSDEILIKDKDGNLSIIQISDLLDGNSPTNNNKEFMKSELENPTEDTISLTLQDTISRLPYVAKIPVSMAYDTTLVEREIDGEKGYIGVLYGTYLYSIPSKYVERYNIDTLTVIASQGKLITLGYDDEIKKPISILDGKLVYREEP